MVYIVEIRLVVSLATRGAIQNDKYALIPALNIPMWS